MKLKWVTNVFLNHPAIPMPGQSPKDANQHGLEWLRDKVLGDPVGDVAKTVPGAKGVYMWVEEAEGEIE
jgi:hypothetical protein